MDSGHNPGKGREPSHPEMDTGTTGFVQLCNLVKKRGFVRCDRRHGLRRIETISIDMATEGTSEKEQQGAAIEHVAHQPCWLPCVSGWEHGGSLEPGARHRGRFGGQGLSAAIR